MVRMLARTAVAAAVLAAPESVAAQAEADVATGCLTRSGRITKVAIGDQPARPCRSRETEITLRLTGGEGDRELVHFFITMDRDGPEETIAMNGPLEIFARCYTEPFFGDSLIFQIVVTSELDGWWISSSRDFPVDAGEELSMLTKSTVAETRLFKGSEVATPGSGLSAMAHDGSYVAIEPDTLGLGLNILGHDCIAVGTAILLKGMLE